MKSRQYSFSSSFFNPVSPAFGGGLQKGKRKTFRPLDPNSPVHLVMKSSRAKGNWSLLHRKHKLKVEDLLSKLAKANGIKINRYVNVGNHLHILLQMKDRKQFQKFLRLFSGRVALLITQARKGNKQGKFWDALAFTRIVKWGKDFANITEYFIKNEIESLGYSTEIARAVLQNGMIILENG